MNDDSKSPSTIGASDPSDLGPRTSDLGLPTSETIDPPPIMRTWRRFYGLVLFVLAADVLVFWIVTRVFS